jgi:hypothetical protein
VEKRVNYHYVAKPTSKPWGSRVTEEFNLGCKPVLPNHILYILVKTAESLDIAELQRYDKKKFKNVEKM